MHKGSKVVIIGGGIIGAATAYYLKQKGWSVTIIDKGRFGYGASHGNCGLIVPDHILPLNSIDNLIKGIGWVFKKDAPLFIKPRIDPALVKWLMKFALHCNQNDILISAKGRAALTQRAIEIYQALIAEEALDCDWAVKGALHIFKSKKEFEKYGSCDALKKEFGIRETPLDRKLLLKQEPAVMDNVAGAWVSRHTAHLRPDGLMKELKRVLIRKGVEIIEQTEVWRPMTCDGLPIIDRSPRLENVMIAAGHNMLGLTMAPGTGKLVSEILSGEAPHVDPYPYRASRF